MVAKQDTRIGIDARLSGREHAGIGRYVENLIQELIALIKNQTTQTTLVLFFFDAKQAKQVLGDKASEPFVKVVLTHIKHYSWAEQRQLPKLYKKAQLDLMYVPHWNVPLAYRGPLMITIHDLLWHEQRGRGATTLKSWQYPIKYLAYLYISGQAIKKALSIFVPTQTIAQTVTRFYPNSKHKIIISKEGLAPTFTKSLAKKDQPSQRLKKQLVYTGSLYPHKNLKLVIQALRKLPSYKLYIVCARNLFQDQIQGLVAKYKVKKQVVFLGFVEDQALINLYQQSMALVQPSFSEGFGLTGIEAMAAPTAVLASDIKVFKEIYQEAAIFFDPHSVQSFVAAVKKLEASNRKDIIKQGKMVAANYSFSSMTALIWQQFQTQLASSS